GGGALEHRRPGPGRRRPFTNTTDCGRTLPGPGRVMTLRARSEAVQEETRAFANMSPRCCRIVAMRVRVRRRWESGAPWAVGRMASHLVGRSRSRRLTVRHAHDPFLDEGVLGAEVFAEGGDVHVASGGEVVFHAHRGGGAGGLADGHDLRGDADGGVGLVRAVDAARGDEHVVETLRADAAVGDFIPLAGGRVDALGAFAGGAVDVDEPVAARDAVLEGGHLDDVVAGHGVVAADAAGFAHADVGRGFGDDGVVETGDVFAHEGGDLGDLAAALDHGVGDVADLGAVLADDAGGVEIPFAGAGVGAGEHVFARDGDFAGGLGGGPEFGEVPVGLAEGLGAVGVHADHF